MLGFVEVDDGEVPRVGLALLVLANALDEDFDFDLEGMAPTTRCASQLSGETSAYRTMTTRDFMLTMSTGVMGSLKKMRFIEMVTMDTFWVNLRAQNTATRS